MASEQLLFLETGLAQAHDIDDATYERLVAVLDCPTIDTDYLAAVIALAAARRPYDEQLLAQVRHELAQQTEPFG